MKEDILRIIELASDFCQHYGQQKERENHFYVRLDMGVEITRCDHCSSESDAIGYKQWSTRHLNISQHNTILLEAEKYLGGSDEYQGYYKTERDYFPEKPWRAINSSIDAKALETIEEQLKTLPTQDNRLDGFKILGMLTNHIADIQNGINQSIDHTFSILLYAQEKGLTYLVDKLKDYTPSAFDQGTIQDLKYHEEASEIYFILQGSMRIFLKEKDSSSSLVITLSAETDSNRYAYIPSKYCLLVLPHKNEKFLAIALKTQESKIGSGKMLGKDCPNYTSYKKCVIHKDCEELRKNRGDFFSAVREKKESAEKENVFSEVREKRETAVNEVNNIASRFTTQI